jgi:hypothetical protein
VKKDLCECEQCAWWRGKGMKSEFTAKECREMKDYARVMLEAMLKRKIAEREAKARVQ